MRVEQLGDGRATVAVVGAIHGDESCGARAVEGLLADPPAVRRPVKLVVANERALERGVRFVDTDLNRAFPGDPDGPTHEERLAAALLAELGGCTTLALHSTQSTDRLFALVDEVDEVARRIVPDLPVDALVETADFAGGRLLPHVPTVEVECGLQGTERAAANAAAVVDAFLRSTGVRPAGDGGGDPDPEPVPVFRLRDRLPKPPDARTFAVHVRNFERVAPGERYASADGEPLVADGPFYPVLLSPYGYDAILGYTADRRGTLG